MPERYTQTPLLTDRFEDALRYATQHHSAQLRKGTAVPYVSHLLAVASLVLEMGGSEDEVIGGLLHDVIEDGGGPRAEAEILERFGEDVRRIVVANSDTDELPKPPALERKRAYVAAIAHKQPDELRVSLADKLHNARAIVLDLRTHGLAVFERFNPAVPTPGYYCALLDAFKERADVLGRGGIVALGELERTVGELVRLVLAAGGTVEPLGTAG